MSIRQMRPPVGGDCWILKIAHAPSPKNLPKNGFCPRKGVAFLRKTFSQKNFQVRERIPLSALVPAHTAAPLPGEAARAPHASGQPPGDLATPVDSEQFRPTLRTCRPGGASLMVRRTDYEGGSPRVRHTTARIHLAWRQRGDMAARGECATACDASGRISQKLPGCRLRIYCRSLSAGPE